MSVELGTATKIAVDAVSAFDSVLQAIVQNGGAVVHLASTSSDSRMPRYIRLGLTKRMEGQFTGVFDAFLKDHAKRWQKGGIELRPYDPATDLKDYMVEWMYLPDYDMIQSQLLPLTGDSSERLSPRDMADKHFVSGLRFYAARVRPLYSSDATFVFYRLYNQSKVLGVSLIGAYWDGRENYDQVQGSAFVFDMSIDCVQVGPYLFIFNKYNVHVMFQLEELIREVARETVSRIIARIPIVNASQFEMDCQKPLSKLLKLRNLGRKSYLDSITIEDLERVIVARDLPISVQETNGKKALVYESSDPWALLTLLDDDQVTGELTSLPYEAHSKSPLAEIKRSSRYRTRRNA